MKHTPHMPMIMKQAKLLNQMVYQQRPQRMLKQMMNQFWKMSTGRKIIEVKWN